MSEIVSVEGRVRPAGQYTFEPKIFVSDLICSDSILYGTALRGEAQLTRHYEAVDVKSRNIR